MSSTRQWVAIIHIQTNCRLEFYTRSCTTVRLNLTLFHISKMRRKVIERKKQRLKESKINNHNFLYYLVEMWLQEGTRSCEAAQCERQLSTADNLESYVFCFYFFWPLRFYKNIFIFLFVIWRSLSSRLFYNPLRINCSVWSEHLIFIRFRTEIFSFPPFNVTQRMGKQSFACNFATKS